MLFQTASHWATRGRLTMNHAKAPRRKEKTDGKTEKLRTERYPDPGRSQCSSVIFLSLIFLSYFSFASWRLCVMIFFRRFVLDLAQGRDNIASDRAPNSRFRLCNRR